MICRKLQSVGPVQPVSCLRLMDGLLWMDNGWIQYQFKNTIHFNQLEKTNKIYKVSENSHTFPLQIPPQSISSETWVLSKTFKLKNQKIDPLKQLPRKINVAVKQVSLNESQLGTLNSEILIEGQMGQVIQEWTK